MKRWAWLIPVLAALVVYARSVEGELVWDDTIVQKKQMVAFKTPRDAFFFDARRIHQFSPYYYRPMVTLSYMLDRRLVAGFTQLGLARADTRVPHATSILYHLLTTVLVWMLTRQVLAGQTFREWGAVLAGLIFAVHPIHTESVSMINGRGDPIAATFMVGALVLAIRYSDRGSTWALALSTLLFLGALLSKEVAVAALPLLPILLLVRAPGPGVPDPSVGRPARKRAARQGAAASAVAKSDRTRLVLLSLLYAGALAIYFALRASVNMRYGQSYEQLSAGELFTRFLGALAYYVKKLAVPWPQSHFMMDLPGPTAGITALIVVVLLVLLSLYLLARRAPLLFVCLALIFLPLAPSLAVALRNIGETPVAERYLYVPSIGFCLLLGAGLAWALARRELRIPAAAAAALLAGGYAFGTVQRGTIWLDDVRLWQDAVAKQPNRGLPWYSLGNAYMDRYNVQQAITCYDKALSDEVQYNAEGRALAWNAKGTALLAQSKEEEALRAFNQSRTVNPTYATPYFNIASIGMDRAEREENATGTFDLQHLAETCEVLNTAIKYNPSYVKAYLARARCLSLIGAVHMDSGSTREAREALNAARQDLETVIRLDADNAGRQARELLGAVSKISQLLPAQPASPTSPPAGPTGSRP